MESSKRRAEVEINKIVCRKKHKREESVEDVEKQEETEEADASSLSRSDGDDDDDVLIFPLLIPSNVGEPSGKAAQKVRELLE
ncbi:hypothetical protein M0R45_031783 [Rubus argutus]|uniref:Uncharacterized protein n=1 Tax=Rubus argutus TaxID=59490 RepID=A0AAW1WEP6_RUBAR